MSPHIPRPGHPVGDDLAGHLDRPADLPSGRLTVDLPTAASTFEFGRDRLAPLLERGDLIVASGRLGVGKTALIQGIGAGLQVAGPVLSPTFVISRVHRGGRMPLVHVDAYRLSSVREIEDLDLDADLADAVTVVEWGQGLVEQLAEGHLLIELTLLLTDPAATGDEPRRATLTPYGEGWRDRLLRLPA